MECRKIWDEVLASDMKDAWTHGQIDTPGHTAQPAQPIPEGSRSKYCSKWFWTGADLNGQTSLSGAEFSIKY